MEIKEAPENKETNEQSDEVSSSEDSEENKSSSDDSTKLKFRVKVGPELKSAKPFTEDLVESESLIGSRIIEFKGKER